MCLAVSEDEFISCEIFTQVHLRKQSVHNITLFQIVPFYQEHMQSLLTTDNICLTDF